MQQARRRDVFPMIKLKTVSKLLLSAVGIIFIFMIGYFAYIQEQPAETPQPSQSEVVQEQKPVEIPTPEDFLARVNEERAKVGAAPLVIDERINKSAQRKADDMANNDYFDHVSPVDGKHGYEYIFDETRPLCTSGGENIQYIKYGVNYSTVPVVETAVDWWVNSPIHYEAMVNKKYQLTGFGVVRGPEKDDSYTVYSVQHFCELR